MVADVGADDLRLAAKRYATLDEPLLKTVHILEMTVGYSLV